jgi:uncharacterized protein
MSIRATCSMVGTLGFAVLLLTGCVFADPPQVIRSAEEPAQFSSGTSYSDSAVAQRVNDTLPATSSSTASHQIQYSSLEPAGEAAAESAADPAVARGVNNTFQAVTSKGEPVRSMLELRHHDVVIQTWDLSCGAAALATLLRYEWGDPVTEKQVAQGLMTRKEYIQHPNVVQIREGFSLLDLKRYADAHGFKGEGYGQLDFNDLIEDAPIMVPVDALGYNHFVVFRGVMGDRVLLADPAWGNRTMTIDKFKRMWLDYGKSMGHVGFLVKRPGVAPASRMLPQPDEFVMFD